MRPRHPLAVLVLLVVTGAVAWGFAVEPGLLEVRRQAAVVPGYPPIRLAMISDLHAGARFMDRAHLTKVVATTNDAHADLVVLLGDYVVGPGNDSGQLPIGEPLPIEEGSARAAIDPRDDARSRAIQRKPRTRPSLLLRMSRSRTTWMT